MLGVAGHCRGVALLLWQQLFGLRLGAGLWRLNHWYVCECIASESLFILYKHTIMEQMAWLSASFFFVFFFTTTVFQTPLASPYLNACKFVFLCSEESFFISSLCGNSFSLYSWPATTVLISNALTTLLDLLNRGKRCRRGDPYWDCYTADSALHSGQSAGPVPPYWRGWTSPSGECQRSHPFTSKCINLLIYSHIVYIFFQCV